MNPSADSFVPKTKSAPATPQKGKTPTSGTPTSPHPPSYNAAVYTDPQRPPPNYNAAVHQQVRTPTKAEPIPDPNLSKLRPSAASFVPRTNSSSGVGGGESGSNDEGNQDSATSSPMKNLSPHADPYTPKSRTPTQRTPNSSEPSNSGSFPAFPSGKGATATATSGGGGAQQPRLSNAMSSVDNLRSTDDLSKFGSPTTMREREVIFAKPFADSKLAVPDAPAAPPAKPMELNCHWTLLADDHPVNFGESKGFGDAFSPVEIATVANLEQFWRLMHHVPNPSNCVPSFTYYLFRKGIKPVWEDPKNANGGKLCITVFDRDKAALNDKIVAGDAWYLTVCACLGEALKDNCVSKVTGLVLKVRKTIQLQLWTNTTAKAQLQTLAAELKKVLGATLPTKTLEKLDFFAHSAAVAEKPAGKATKPKYGQKPTKAVPSAREPDYVL